MASLRLNDNTIIRVSDNFVKDSLILSEFQDEGDIIFNIYDYDANAVKLLVELYDKNDLTVFKNLRLLETLHLLEITLYLNLFNIYDVLLDSVVQSIYDKSCIQFHLKRDVITYFETLPTIIQEHIQLNLHKFVERYEIKNQIDNVNLPLTVISATNNSRFEEYSYRYDLCQLYSNLINISTYNYQILITRHPSPYERKIYKNGKYKKKIKSNVRNGKVGITDNGGIYSIKLLGGSNKDIFDPIDATKGSIIKYNNKKLYEVEGVDISLARDGSRYLHIDTEYDTFNINNMTNNNVIYQNNLSIAGISHIVSPNMKYIIKNVNRNYELIKIDGNENISLSSLNELISKLNTEKFNVYFDFSATENHILVSIIFKNNGFLYTKYILLYNLQSMELVLHKEIEEDQNYYIKSISDNGIFTYLDGISMTGYQLYKKQIIFIPFKNHNGYIRNLNVTQNVEIDVGRIYVDKNRIINGYNNSIIIEFPNKSIVYDDLSFKYDNLSSLLNEII